MLRQIYVIGADPPGAVFLSPEQTQDRRVATLRTKTQRHAEGAAVVERHGIGRNRAAAAGVTLEGVAKCSREVRQAE